MTPRPNKFGPLVRVLQNSTIARAQGRIVRWTSQWPREPRLTKNTGGGTGSSARTSSGRREATSAFPPPAAPNWNWRQRANPGSRGTSMISHAALGTSRAAQRMSRLMIVQSLAFRPTNMPVAALGRNRMSVTVPIQSKNSIREAASEPQRAVGLRVRNRIFAPTVRNDRRHRPLFSAEYSGPRARRAEFEAPAKWATFKPDDPASFNVTKRRQASPEGMAPGSLRALNVRGLDSRDATMTPFPTSQSVNQDNYPGGIPAKHLARLDTLPAGSTRLMTPDRISKANGNATKLGSGTAQGYLASNAAQSGVAGELWLDTLSLQNWLHSYLSNEMRHTSSTLSRIENYVPQT